MDRVESVWVWVLFEALKPKVEVDLDWNRLSLGFGIWFVLGLECGLRLGIEVFFSFYVLGDDLFHERDVSFRVFWGILVVKSSNELIGFVSRV